MGRLLTRMQNLVSSLMHFSFRPRARGPGEAEVFRPLCLYRAHGGLQLNTKYTPPEPLWKPDIPLLNYFDTDHWVDRVQPGNDFAGLAAAVVFDPGGFEVIRQLNKEMHDQNLATQPGSVQERAAQHWLDLHVEQPRLRSRPVKARAPADRAGSASADDQKVLATFNQYCFRCHGVGGV